MSIEHMSAVWKDQYYGQGDKSKLLVALAIADSANADGYAFPSIDFIADKSRTRPRGVQELCRELEKDGKLEIHAGKGRNGTNLYRVLGVRLSHPTKDEASVNGVRLSQGAPIAGCVRAAEKAAVAPSPKRHRAARLPLECEAFTEFWKSYPRKEAKGNAEEAWLKNGCAELLPIILVAIRKAKGCEQWTKDGGRWIPHPATWLNRRGWEDEFLPFQAAQRKQTPGYV